MFLDLHEGVLAEFAAWDSVLEDKEIVRRCDVIERKREYRRDWQANRRAEIRIQNLGKRPKLCAWCRASMGEKRGKFCRTQCCTDSYLADQKRAADASPLRTAHARRIAAAVAKRDGR